MSGEIIELDRKNLPTQLASRLGGEDINDDLSAGVTGGFGVVSIRGRNWRVKSGGEETLLEKDGDPVGSIYALILKANPHVSKNFYEGGYAEGSSDAPDCWSMDGVKPDPGVERPVHSNCAGCPKNVFGSRITDTGSKAKACSDNRRLAILPEGDLKNEQFGGGPLLLRVPAASLSELATFGKGMKAKGFPYNTIITKLSFDPDVAYPKLKFKAARPLSADEEAEVMELLDDQEFIDKLNFVLAEPVELEEGKIETEAPAAPVEDDPLEFESEAKPEEPAPKKRGRPKKTEAKAEAPAPEPEAATAGDDDLDDILAQLDNLD